MSFSFIPTSRAMRALLCAPVLLLCSCAIAPAGVRRVLSEQEVRGEKLRLHALLTRALDEPDSDAGRLALGRFIEAWKESGRGETGDLPSALDDDGVTYRVRFSGGHPGADPLGYFDQISPAAEFEVKKLPHHRRAGVGVPLKALRENRHREPLEKFFPPEAITRPLTAVVTAGPARRKVREVQIRLLSPLLHSEIGTPQGRRPLAADFSVPWAALLARSGKLNQLRVLDMITRTPQREPRLYLMEPYDPDKEPLIMIHGLLSTPLAWAELSNELWSDDAIRRRYQIWHYLYNTSAPALYSSRQLRMQLRELRGLLDPEGDDPAMRRTTLLTHSMGGLVGKALAMSPGDAFWRAAFNVPHAQLSLSREDRAALHEAFEWEADPTVRRIIFIATPHCGSSFADNLIGRLGSWLTRPPQHFQDFYRRVSAANPGAFTAAYAELGTGRLDSVNALSPRQPTLRILADLPYAHRVKTHSIIGNRGRPGPLEHSSDGIVPYGSSHIDDAESELVVPAGHGAFRHPMAVSEVRRILKL